MTRRERLMARIAEAQAQLDEVRGRINDPSTPPSRVPPLENRAANLERRISEMNQELANLPEDAGGAAGVLAIAPAKRASKRAGRKRPIGRAARG
ncbi:hypothetical protein [Paludibaculum fermentans]|uniref:hypothetical protein n=1 Tax=Paludibaculum fermentans TaxID=1473598 RepID=UPI003EB9E577